MYKNTFKTQKNLFKIYQNKSIVFKISFTGVFLALILIFQFLEEFMPFVKGLMNINLTLMFVLPIFYFAGPIFGFVSILLRFAIGPALSSSFGYTVIGLIGHFALLLTTSFAIMYQFIFSHIFAYLTSNWKKGLVISSFIVFFTALTMTVLNGVLIVPLYSLVFNLTPNLSLEKTIVKYPGSLQILFFNIPSYWGGIFAVYMTGNIVSLSINYFLNYPLSKVIKNFY